MSEIHWVKLSTAMFDDEKIKAIRSMPSGDSLCLIWIQLISLAGKTNDRGQIYLSEDIPYTDTILANSIGHKVETVHLALSTFRKMGMIELLANDRIALINWEKHQNMDGLERVRQLTRARVEKYRQKLVACNVTSSATVTPGNAIDSDSDSDSDSDLNERKQLLPGGGPRGRDQHAPPPAAPAGPQRPAGQPDVDQIAEIASQPLEPSVIDFSGLPPHLRVATERARVKVAADAKEKAENLTHKTADYHALKAPQNGKPDRDAEWEAVADAKAKLPYSARGAPPEHDAPDAPPGDDFDDPPDDIHEDDT